MAEGLFITRTEWNQLMKRLEYLEQYVKHSLRERKKSMWMTKQEAMEEIGCKERTLEKLRLTGSIHFKYSGKGRGVMILRKSVEEFNLQNSTLL